MTPKLLTAIPQLFTCDLTASLAFFEKLGFKPAFTYGEPPFYAQVVRDGVALNLRHVDTPVTDKARAAAEDLLAVSITLDTDAAAETLFNEFSGAGIQFHQQLARQPWGALDFIAVDPNGNLLHFAGPAH